MVAGERNTLAFVAVARSPTRIELGPRRILFEDADLLAVDKPPGLPSHATVDRERDHLVAAVRRYLVERDRIEPYLAQHHRLDRDTSGVVLFARDASVNAPLGRAFREGRVEKTYLAIVCERPSHRFPRGTVEMASHLAPGPAKGGVEVKVCEEDDAHGRGFSSRRPARCP